MDWRDLQQGSSPQDCARSALCTLSMGELPPTAKVMLPDVKAPRRRCMSLEDWWGEGNSAVTPFVRSSGWRLSQAERPPVQASEQFVKRDTIGLWRVWWGEKGRLTSCIRRVLDIASLNNWFHRGIPAAAGGVRLRCGSKASYDHRRL